MNIDLIPNKSRRQPENEEERQKYRKQFVSSSR
jgi:hypothetical protein